MPTGETGGALTAVASCDECSFPPSRASSALDRSLGWRRLWSRRSVPGQHDHPGKLDNNLESAVCPMARVAVRLRLQPTTRQSSRDSWSCREYVGPCWLLPHGHGAVRGRAMELHFPRGSWPAPVEHAEHHRRFGYRTPVRLPRTTLADSARLDQRSARGRCPVPGAVRAFCRGQDFPRGVHSSLESRGRCGDRDGGVLRHRGLGMSTSPFRTPVS